MGENLFTIFGIDISEFVSAAVDGNGFLVGLKEVNTHFIAVASRLDGLGKMPLKIVAEINKYLEVANFAFYWLGHFTVAGWFNKFR